MFCLLLLYLYLSLTPSLPFSVILFTLNLLLLKYNETLLVRAGEPEQVVFGCSEPEPAEEKTRSRSRAAQKKTGARADQKKQESEPLKKTQEPEPLKKNRSRSRSKKTGAAKIRRLRLLMAKN